MDEAEPLSHRSQQSAGGHREAAVSPRHWTLRGQAPDAHDVAERECLAIAAYPVHCCTYGIHTLTVCNKAWPPTCMSASDQYTELDLPSCIHNH